VGGVIAAVVLALLLLPLARLAVSFGPAGTASLMLLGVAAAVALSPAPLPAAWALAALGALLGLVGTDVAGGRPRFTFGVSELADGIGFIPLAMGLFGVAELIRAVEAGGAGQRVLPVGSPFRRAPTLPPPPSRRCAAARSAARSGCCRAAPRCLRHWPRRPPSAGCSAAAAAGARARWRALPHPRRRTTLPRRPRSRRCWRWGCRRTR
jgi:hypothetical protein